MGWGSRAKDVDMGVLVEGVWRDEQHGERAPTGRFLRPPTRFRNWITEDGRPAPTGTDGFAAARGRYHLYVALACPWAHRTMIMRVLKGLEDLISMSVVEPLYGPHGWRFGDSPGAVADSVNGASEEAFRALFAALDEIEQRLSRQRYLAGREITEADWRLFTTLVRFDAVYYGHFKCN